MKTKKRKPYPIATINNVFHQPIDDLFGIVSDTHFGSKYEALRELQEMYDYLDERGVKQVYHAGDVSDGLYVYRGQLSDQHKIGYEEQANWIIKKYPRKKNITTYMIMGNHDASYMKSQGADIIKYVCSYRKDLEYVGIYFSRFHDRDKGIKLDLVHPSGAAAYSISYGMQKYLRNQPPSHYPSILIHGHRHQSWFGYYHEVYCFEAGCFMHPTDFLIRKGIGSSIGGWLVDMKVKNKKIKKMRVEWVGF